MEICQRNVIPNIRDFKEVLVHKEAIWEDLEQASLDRRHFFLSSLLSELKCTAFQEGGEVIVLSAGAFLFPL